MAARALPWATEARRAVDARLHGRVTVRQLQGLRAAKARVLMAIPERPNPAETDLHARLTRQVEALDLVLAALRNESFDRDRLVELTVSEAWRLNRQDLLVATWYGADHAPLTL